MHIHTLTLDVPRSTRVFCEGCDVELRLATGDEARFVQMTDGFAEGGPMVGPRNVVVVPLNYNIFQEA